MLRLAQTRGMPPGSDPMEALDKHEGVLTEGPKCQMTDEIRGYVRIAA